MSGSSTSTECGRIRWCRKRPAASGSDCDTSSSFPRVARDPRVQETPGCLRIRLRDLLELPQQRAVYRDLVVEGVEPRRDRVPLLGAALHVAHLLGPRPPRLGAAAARVELLLEADQANLDCLRRTLASRRLRRRAAARRALAPC